MDQDEKRRIRELAYSLWISADRPYWKALDYWLMAEHMIADVAKFANRRARQP